MKKTIYDSRDQQFKTPFGAVPVGETVTFTIRLPKRRIGEPMLKLYRMDYWDDPAPFPMELVDSDFLHNYYRCTFTPTEPCLYVYHFEVFMDGRLLQIKRSENGVGDFDKHGDLWQLTVYAADMQPPAFLKEGVLYQIFPDRFHYSGEKKENVPADRQLRDDWGGLPVWQPNHEGVVTNSDYFQGDLQGIRQKLDYLQGLGVTALYLNPIFEAHSNHRYNTADYERIDPLLGTEKDFRELCADAKKRGISVVLDGVFSHTGSDSVYFNKERRYGDGGAYNDPDSPYRPWYQFRNYPETYESWWGFVTLPNVQEEHPAYMDFICGEDGVLRKWMRAGAAGWRLDVADELPDTFLDNVRASIKEENPDGAVIGEVWEDASNKESYGVRRRYLLGQQLDSVMNYPFKDAILGFIRWGSGDLLYQIIMQVLENYPKPVIQCLMNSLSTHDTPRAITELVGMPLEHNGRDWQHRHHMLPADSYAHGCRLFQLASILQFGLPGVPCVYYGDEAGLTGYRDPFNRTCYPWGQENQDVLACIRRLGGIRQEYPIFAKAAFIPYVFSHEVCAFARQTEQVTILFMVNRSNSRQKVELPARLRQAAPLLTVGEYNKQVLEPFSGVVLASGDRQSRV